MSLSCKVVASHATAWMRQYGVSFVPTIRTIGLSGSRNKASSIFYLIEQVALKQSYSLTIAPVQFTRVALLSGGTGNNLNANLGYPY
jgi:hypothetical protein